MQKEKYTNLLANLNLQSETLAGFQAGLLDYRLQARYPDDYHAWIAATLALKAIADNNFGIGSLLLDEKGNIVAEGHNHVFSPYFRSDRHAEMVVLNDFENKMQYRDAKEDIRIDQYTLFTSLEPCPMCSARIITSGIGRIKFTVEDDTGGFARTIGEFPAAWQDLANKPYKQYFTRADCSRELVAISSDIFLYNADRLNTQLRRIYQSRG